MNSWDCFDTLLARRYVHPHTVFIETGKRLGDSDFLGKRLSAESMSNGTYSSIYERLPNIDPEIEFQVELEHCFGIVENINRVKDGDIVVSDMYLTADHIKRLLVSCGLKKDIKIHVTPGGKREGWIWNHLNGIDLHVGDNYNADVASPSQHGIKAEHYNGHLFNNIEEEVSKSDHQLACWMRYIRLNCPYNGDEAKYWFDQSNYNLPVLALASLELPDEPLAFTYRDCIYFHPLYEKITGKTAVKLHASRHCYYNPMDGYIDHVLKQTEGRTIVDLQGSGKSIASFFEKLQKPMPKVIYLSGPAEKPFEVILDIGTDTLERHNCSELGTLAGFSDLPIRLFSEHPENVIKVQSEAMKLAIDSTHLFSINRNKTLMNNLWIKMCTDFTYKSMNWSGEHFIG